MLGKEVLNELFSSEDMRNHLEKKFDELDAYTIANLIYNAPIELKRKIELLDMLEIDLDAFHKYYFYKKLEWFMEEESGLEDFFEVTKHLEFLTHQDKDKKLEVEKIVFNKCEELQEYFFNEENFTQEHKERAWYEVEKWRVQGEGDVVLRNKYVIWNGLKCQTDVFHVGYIIDTPFKAGDVIEVDCRPFCPIYHFVVLETNDDNEGFPKVLYVNGDNKVNIDPKDNRFPKSFLKGCPIPALYSAKVLKGVLPEKEIFLEVVSQWIRGNVDKGKKLYNYIMEKRSPEGIKMEVLNTFLQEETNSDISVFNNIQNIADEHPFLMTVEVSSVLRGKGTIIYGRVESGTIYVGDEVLIHRTEGENKKCRVKASGKCRWTEDEYLILSNVFMDEINEGDIITKV